MGGYHGDVLYENLELIRTVRAFCSWLALGVRYTRGGMRYSGGRLRVAAHSTASCGAAPRPGQSPVSDQRELSRSRFPEVDPLGSWLARCKLART